MADKSSKDPMLSNKIAGAVLAALLLVFGLPQLTAALIGGGEGHGGGEAAELHLAYCCVELETETAATVEEAPPDLGTLLASASVASGERKAALCKSCHTLSEGGANSAGPNLWGVVGRPVASVDGFNYTSAITAAGGAWTYDRLDQYLKNSQDYIPGTAMVQRFAKDGQRADILAYLGSLSASPVAFPAPVVVEAPATDEAAEDVAEDAGEEAPSGH
jgi:cytochrome c